MAVKILCTGDLHIGRRPSKLPSAAEGRRLSCAAMWEALVECALRERVDVLALSGDIVDRSHRFFEALGPLEAGIRRLAEAGIDTVAVSGNHDWDVFPQLVRKVDSPYFHLVGAGGSWERVEIRRDGVPVLHVDGWSFPREQVTDSPLASYRLPPSPGIPVLGLVHADLDQPASRHAPVRLAELRPRPVSLWLLGHVHKPFYHPPAGGCPVLNPGSPQAMDPGETGCHGPWLVTLSSGAAVETAQLTLSRVRYETLAVDLTDAEGEETLRERVVETLHAFREAERGAFGELEWLSVRLRLEGRTSLHRRLGPLAARLFDETFDMRDGHVRFCVDGVEIETRPAVDLEKLAGAQDPPGELARVLQELQSEPPSPRAERLIRDAARRMAEVHHHAHYVPISTGALPTPEAARLGLLREGYLLLNTLLAQKEEA